VLNKLILPEFLSNTGDGLPHVLFPSSHMTFKADQVFPLSDDFFNTRSMSPVSLQLFFLPSANAKRVPFLDFKIESKNLIALNTQSSDNEYYYGTGFLNGSAYFIGPGKDLDIEINGATQENTKIIIPIRYGDGLDQLSYLTFKENNKD